MGLHNTAHYLKSKGRGTDTELVHMSKREIKGLQQLAMAHGGSLTINPDTGLVEAGFLEQALPIVAAAAATYFTAGAAAPALTAALGGSAMAGGIAAGALAGAGISGLTAAVTGKDVGNAALMGGVGGAISGGLGAYGEAPNLLADATQKTAIEGGTQAATQGATEAATQTATNALPTGYTGTAFSPAEMAAGSGPASSLNTGLGYDPSTGVGTTPMSGYGTAQASMPTQAQLQATQGFTGMQSPSPVDQSYYASLKPDQYIQKAGILALPAAGLVGDQQQQQLGPEDETSPVPRISSNFQAYVPPQPNPYYKAKYPKYAKGGLPADAMKDMPSFNPKIVTDSDANTRGLSALDATNYRNKKLMAKAGIKMAEMPKTGIKSLGGDFSDVGAGGGVAHLGDYSDGGRLLKGPGDGMSDNIPATIGRKQPARLADGEFVVPSDVVSHLGNGSTDAGAKKLYAMMDKIRRARTGKKKQAPAVNPNKYLPA